MTATSDYYLALFGGMSDADRAVIGGVLALRRRIAERVEGVTKRTVTDLKASLDRNRREAAENLIRIDGMLAVATIMAEEFNRDMDAILARYQPDS